jgi:uncharacterized LabA/DUF88 family protein
MASGDHRIAVLIDGPSLHGASRALGFEVDFRRLLAELQDRATLSRAFYYTVVLEHQAFSLRPLLDWLEYNGFTVIAKPATLFDDGEGRRKIKRSTRVELVVDAFAMADQVDEIILFSGDGDFCPLIEALQRRGVRVTVVSTVSTQPPMIADELRRRADVFIDLMELQSRIGREVRY